MQERAEAKANKVCNNFLIGRCAYGGECRFGHDAAEYLKTAPANLPGPCPQEQPDKGLHCPFGARCHQTEHSEMAG